MARAMAVMASAFGWRARGPNESGEDVNVRPKAEAIASEYREQLYHQREVLKQWRESQGGG